MSDTLEAGDMGTSRPILLKDLAEQWGWLVSSFCILTQREWAEDVLS